MADGDVSAGPPPSVETQDPLPENNWLWRRVFVFSLCTVIFVGCWIEIQTMVNLAGDNPELIVGAFIQIIKWELIIAWCAMTYYLIAPSAEQLGRWMATVSAWKAGVSTSTTQTATSASGSTATATTQTGVVGMPTQPPQTPPAAFTGTGLPDNPYTGPEMPPVVEGTVPPWER